MRRKILALFFFALAFAGVREANAGLGQSADSIASDQRFLSAEKRPTTSGNGYSIHELTADGTDVREYVSPEGIVFGIAWSGLTHPDLTGLLGPYVREYESALRAAPRKHGLRRHGVLQTERIVVEKWGHMRDLHGRAYAPALIPPGVTPDEIR